MHVFISWSGELSKRIAEILGKKIPCVIQSVTAFVSSSDIEKGENWDSRISEELAGAKFGIVCLTLENVQAPWVHFEAGAISQSLDSRVSALMINLNPSDLQGPLKRFQATRVEKSDFLSLLHSINDSLENAIPKEVLIDCFEMGWPSIESEINTAISTYSPRKDTKRSAHKTEESLNAAIEEILALTRKQSSMLSDPEQLLPPRYLSEVVSMSSRSGSNRAGEISMRVLEEVIDWYEHAVSVLSSRELDEIDLYELIDMDEFLEHIYRITREFPSMYREKCEKRIMMLRDYRGRNLSTKRVAPPVARRKPMQTRVLEPSGDDAL